MVIQLYKMSSFYNMLYKMQIGSTHSHIFLSVKREFIPEEVSRMQFGGFMEIDELLRLLCVLVRFNDF